MAPGEVVVLGAIAGLTIFLGLPVARLRRPAPRLKAFLNALSIGILVFLLWDVLSKAFEPVDKALTDAGAGHGSWLRFAGLAAVLFGGAAIGLMTLVYYDKVLAAKRPGRAVGAAAAAALPARTGLVARLDGAERMAFFIALGIGLHNFGEGLAIGQSAARGQLQLATVLIVGFALHNATEGFGICGPLAAEGRRPTWAFLTVMGLIGGGPTFLGTVIGQAVTNDVLFTSFLALAAGSILFVVVELIGVARRFGSKELVMWGILAGVVLGFATDMVLTAAGA